MSESETIRLHVQFSPQERIAAYLEVSAEICRRAQAMPSLPVQIVVGLPFGFTIAHLMYSGNRLGALLVLGSLLILWIAMSAMQSTLRKRMADYVTADPHFRDVTFEFSDTGIAIGTSNIELRAKWSAVRRVVESEHFLFLYCDNAAAWTIPKRMQESQAVCELAVSKVKVETGT